MNLLDIELLTIKIRLLIVSVDKAAEMGIDWWRNDPMLSSQAQDLSEENRELRERLAELESAHERRRGRMTMSADGLYLFAVGRGLDSSVLSGVEGIDGAVLQVVDHQDLQAVVCAVDLDEFGEASLARNLEDLAWLEQVARAHNDVVSAVAESGTVAPMRLVTICEGEKSVRDRIEALYLGPVGCAGPRRG